MVGTVKRFDKDKGYGFIVGEDGKDYFFHYSELIMEGFKTVGLNKKVKFEKSETEKGLRASHIEVIEEETK